MKTLSILFTHALTSILVLACKGKSEETVPADPATVLLVHTTQRAVFQVVGADTLSDHARIIAILPEQDGDGIVALFTDPARQVSAGLAILDRRMTTPQLLWPDSVTGMWWTGPHMLAFTTMTGEGIRLVVDVHAAELQVADTLTTGVIPLPALAVADSLTTHQARAYIDSIHMQSTGAPQRSMLTYSLTRAVPSPDMTMVAFHSVARDIHGALANPSWFILDRTSQSVTLLDRITGSASELPAQAGEWSANTSFYYAKGDAVWEAEIRRAVAFP